ncbi:T9SS type A sorting domain-containing protein, partial [candidate division WOR-3 bacterium]|nr:T9SS type A sorting domain-containing protein [candidate division WOR-3 bacterium]
LYGVGAREPNAEMPDTLLPIPVVVTGEEDGRLDPGDRLVFYGVGAGGWRGLCSSYVRNLYTKVNVYWLTWGGAPGLRMDRGLGPDTAGLETVFLGRDRVHHEPDVECPARSGLLWLWRTLDKDAYLPSVRFETGLGLSVPVRLTGLTIRLFAQSAANVLGLELNGRRLATLEFDEAPVTNPRLFVIDTMAVLNPADNRLVFELAGDGSKRVLLDWLEADYQRRLSLRGGQLHFIEDRPGSFRFRVADAPGLPVVLDVTDPHRPRQADGVALASDTAWFTRRLAGPTRFCAAAPGQFLRPARVEFRSPGRLVAPMRRADYWVVSPGQFAGAAERFARFREGRIPWMTGARVEVARLEDVYDDYGFGLEEPRAVKRFLADKRPAYALLVGDATYDYRDNLGLGRTPGVPAYEIGLSFDPSGISSREALALDAWYADFEGEGGTPDLMLGRLTARTGAEFGVYVDKLSAYESGEGGAWTRRLLLLADDEYLGEVRRPDPIGFNHIEQCERMAAVAGAAADAAKVYLTEFPLVGVKNKPGARAELLRELRRGALVFLFFGHGDAFDLCHESSFNVIQVPLLDNGGRAPFCFYGSCSVGRFEDTRYECIAEEVVRLPGGGAIAAVGGTKATTSGANEVFAVNLLTPLYGAPDSTVGLAFFRAWPTDRVYHLFGDPAVRLRLPAVSGEPPWVWPDTLRPGGGFRAYANPGVEEGRFEWTLFGPRRLRRYSSDRGTASYVVPGYEAARGRGEVRGNGLDWRGTLPAVLPLDTVFVANGWYVPAELACRLSAAAYAGEFEPALLHDPVPLGRDVPPSADSSGPEVRMFRAGIPLADNCTVPAAFELEGVVSDPSGLLIARLPNLLPWFHVNSGEQAQDLADALVFDQGSATTARFRVGLELAGEEDTLWAEVFDNRANRTLASVVVRPEPAGGVLALDSALVYPNPVRGRVWLTFRLNRAATVWARVYTMQGRLVRELGPLAAAEGFNSLEWDGRDRLGALPANGVYLYTLTARAQGQSGPEQKTLRDRLLVLR